ncbi:MAG: ATP-binding protein [Bacteroidales bacterium]
MDLPRRHYIIFLVLASFLFSSEICAQERGLLLSKYYSPKDYKQGVQNWSVTQDKRGVLYFGNAYGVMEYDGVNWRLIKVANNSAARCLSINENNVLFVGAFGELGCLLPNEKGELLYNSLMPLLDNEHADFGEIWDINCFSDSVFFLSDKYLFLYNNNKFDYWESKKERFYLSYNVNNDLYIQEMGKGLLKFEKGSLNLIEKGEFFTDIRIHSIFPLEDKLLICTRSDGFFIYEKKDGKVSIKSLGEISTQTKKINEYFIKHSFYHGVKIHNNQLALASITDNIIIVDPNWNVTDVIDSKSIGIKGSSFYLYYRNNQSLWLALDNGVCHVDVLSPFRYWNEEAGIHGTLSDVAIQNNYHYAATGSGVYWTPIKSTDIFSNSNFYPIDEIFEQVWGFLYFQPFPESQQLPSMANYNSNSNTILLLASNRGLFQIKGAEAIKLVDKYAYRLYQYKKNPTKLFFSSNTGISMLTYKKGQWENNGSMFGIKDLVRDIREDSLGNLWLISPFKGLFHIENPLSLNNQSFTKHLYDTSDGFSSVQDVYIYESDSGFIFISDKQLYRFRSNTRRFEKIDYNPTEISGDTLSEYRVKGEVISDVYQTTYEDPTLWFGTTKGVFKFDTTNFRNYFDVFPAIIRQVAVGDSIIYYGTNYKPYKSASKAKFPNLLLNPDPVVSNGVILSYKDNSLTFSFANPSFDDESKNLYSCLLDDYDKDWSSWNSEAKRVYTNLPEGKYVFKVKSKNLYQVESAVASFEFEILPPWYRTIWAYLGYVLVSILFIIGIVKIYTYRLIKEKENLERIVKERTQEILMQNEEIMVQAEHLKDANDWISAKNIELENQKEEIEKKKDQLEISNATKNKFFRIIAHDLRNPISTLLNSTAYVLTDIEDYSKEKTKTFISELNKLSQTTYNLLENLLDWSTSQMGEIKFNPKTINIVGVIKENIELIKNKLDSKKITLTLDLPQKADVFVDENMINTVIRNLISNAAKFTNENGEIKISCKTENNICIISISDNGIGISKENFDKLFRIDQHHTTLGTQNEKGSGLGLILCKEFIEQNGGTISVTSEPGKGSTFNFTLNLA